MDDERNEGAGERPKFFHSVNGWLGGITGLIVAVSGLLVAWQQFDRSEPDAEAAPAVEAAADDASTDAEPSEATAEPLPLKYEAVDATFEKIDGEWIYASDAEETRYREVSRGGGNTVVFDPIRKVYARWPDQGGMVEEKAIADAAEWENSFDIWVPKAAQPTE